MSTSIQQLETSMIAFQNVFYLVVNHPSESVLPTQAGIPKNEKVDVLAFTNNVLTDIKNLLGNDRNNSELAFMLLSNVTVIRLKTHQLTSDKLVSQIKSSKVETLFTKLEFTIKTETQYQTFIANLNQKEYRCALSNFESIYNAQVFQLFETEQLGEGDFKVFDEHFKTLWNDHITALNKPQTNASSHHSSEASTASLKKSFKSLNKGKKRKKSVNSNEESSRPPLYQCAYSLVEVLKEAFSAMDFAENYIKAAYGVWQMVPSQGAATANGVLRETPEASHADYLLKLQTKFFTEISRSKDFSVRVLQLNDTDVLILESYSPPFPFGTETQVTEEQQIYILGRVKSLSDPTEFLRFLDKLYALKRSEQLKLREDEFFAIKALHDLYHNTKRQHVGSTAGVMESRDLAVHLVESPFFIEEFRRVILKSYIPLDANADNLTLQEELRRKYILVKKWMDKKFFSSLLGPEKLDNEIKEKDESQNSKAKVSTRKSLTGSKKRKHEDPSEGNSSSQTAVVSSSTTAVASGALTEVITGSITKETSFSCLVEELEGDSIWRFFGKPRQIAVLNEPIKWVYENPGQLIESDVDIARRKTITSNFSGTLILRQAPQPITRLGNLEQWFLDILNNPSRDGAILLSDQEHRPWFNEVMTTVQAQLGSNFSTKLMVLAKLSPLHYLPLCAKKSWFSDTLEMEELAAHWISRIQATPDQLTEPEFHMAMGYMLESSQNTQTFMFSAFIKILMTSRSAEQQTIFMKWGEWFLSSRSSSFVNKLQDAYLRGMPVLYPWLVLAKNRLESELKVKNENAQTEMVVAKPIVKKNAFQKALENMILCFLESQPRALHNIRRRVVFYKPIDPIFSEHLALLDETILAQTIIFWKSKISVVLGIKYDDFPIKSDNGNIIVEFSAVNQRIKDSICGVSIQHALRALQILSGIHIPTGLSREQVFFLASPSNLYLNFGLAEQSKTFEKSYRENFCAEFKRHLLLKINGFSKNLNFSEVLPNHCHSDQLHGFEDRLVVTGFVLPFAGTSTSDSEVALVQDKESQKVSNELYFLAIINALKGNNMACTDIMFYDTAGSITANFSIYLEGKMPLMNGDFRNILNESDPEALLDKIADDFQNNLKKLLEDPQKAKSEVDELMIKSKIQVRHSSGTSSSSSSHTSISSSSSSRSVSSTGMTFTSAEAVSLLEDGVRGVGSIDEPQKTEREGRELKESQDLSDEDESNPQSTRARVFSDTVLFSRASLNTRLTQHHSFPVNNTNPPADSTQANADTQTNNSNRQSRGRGRGRGRGQG